MLTVYKIVYELSHRIRKIEIEADSPNAALKKFKEIMPTIMYKNLAIREIELEPINPYIEKWDKKYCFHCEPPNTITK